jgi:hypothetical protein
MRKLSITGPDAVPHPDAAAMALTLSISHGATRSPAGDPLYAVNFGYKVFHDTDALTSFSDPLPHSYDQQFHASGAAYFGVVGTKLRDILPDYFPAEDPRGDITALDVVTLVMDRHATTHPTVRGGTALQSSTYEDVPPGTWVTTPPG